MKTLIVSTRSFTSIADDAKEFMKKAKQKKNTASHKEISFSEKKEFDKFIKNIDIINAILKEKPNSIYELAKILDRDEPNLRRVIAFLDEVGAIKIKKSILSGREVKQPIVEYDEIQIKLAS